MVVAWPISWGVTLWLWQSLPLSAGINPEPKYDVYFDLYIFSEYKRVLIGNLGKRGKCLLILLKVQNVYSVKGAIYPL